MMKNEKIEKELFLEQESSHEKIKEKITTGNKIIEWEPMENKVKKGLDTDELGFKCIVAILIVISPFILLYELGENDPYDLGIMCACFDLEWLLDGEGIV